MTSPQIAAAMSNEWKEQYFQLLRDCEELANPELFLPLLKLKISNRPRALYRYRSFDEKGYSLASLQDDTTWLSSPNDFNDPFDSNFQISPGQNLLRFFEKDLPYFLKEIGWELPGPEAATKSALAEQDPFDALFNVAVATTENRRPGDRLFFKEELQRIVVEKSRSSLFRLTEKVRNNLRICCFSEVPDSILMWSHYARGHSGFCVEYSGIELFENRGILLSLHPVHYQSDFYDATSQLDTIYDPLFAFHIIAACIKSPQWAYEKEWRLIRQSDSELPIFRLPPPSRIILGAKISAENRKAISAIADEKGISISSAQLGRNEVSIEVRALDQSL